MSLFCHLLIDATNGGGAGYLLVPVAARIDMFLIFIPRQIKHVERESFLLELKSRLFVPPKLELWKFVSCNFCRNCYCDSMYISMVDNFGLLEVYVERDQKKIEQKICRIYVWIRLMSF